jgi:prevent-host-death family protein
MISMTWQLQEAKNKFSQVVNNSLEQGPQIISRHGQNTAVLISFADYQKLTKKKPTVQQALMATDISDLDLSFDKSTIAHATPTIFDQSKR